MSWITVLYNSTDPGGVAHVDITKSTAKTLGFQVRLVQVRSAADFDAAFAAILRERPDALLTVTDPLVFAHRERIAQFTLQNKIPSIFEFKPFVDLGGLMSYGPNMPER